MDLLGNIDTLSKALIGVMTLGAMMFGFFRWVHPGWRTLMSDARAGRDALVGRDAVYDSITGKELSPALPGIGVRQDRTETAVALLTDAVAQLARTTLRLDDLDLRVRHIEDDHGSRLRVLEEAHVERVITRAESAAAWQAVEAVAKATPPDEPVPSLGEN